MTKTAAALLLLASAFAGHSALAATSDDAKWVAKCVSDNAGARNVSVEIIAKYCTCMNNKMDDNETLSITAWEKTPVGRTAMAACDKESGWDKK